MDSLKKWREPAAWILVGALVLNLVLNLVNLTVLPQSVGVLAYRIADPLAIIVLAALVAGCVVVDPIPRAGVLTIVSTVTVAVVLLAALAMALLGLGQGPTDLLFNLAGLLIYLVVPALGLSLMIKVWLLHQRSAGQPAPAPPALPPAAPALPPPPDPQLQPTWQPDAAAGAVWRTAGDAASGAPASGWGAPGPEVGWNPIPSSDTEAGRADPNIR